MAALPAVKTAGKAESRDVSTRSAEVVSLQEELEEKVLSQLDVEELFVGKYFLESDKGLCSTHLACYSIFPASLSAEERQSLVERGVASSPQADRAVGAMVGMAIGDWVGHPFEFISIEQSGFLSDGEDAKVEEDTPWFELATGEFHNELNRFRLERGQWTDDASMGLCQADSLLVCGFYDGSDIRTRFWNWWHSSYNTPFTDRGACGLGGNIGSSIYALSFEETPSERYEVEHGRDDSGNGSLMRLAAIPLLFHADVEVAVAYSKESSLTTHPGHTAAECCGLMGFVIAKAVARSGAECMAEWLVSVTEEYAGRLEREVAGEECASVRRAKQVVLRLIAADEDEEGTEAVWNWRSEKGALPALACW